MGSGPNGAIVHYRPTLESHGVSDSLLTPILIDTGGHYLDGTTDTTRTLAFGLDPSCERYPRLSEMYTRVLLGNIDFELTHFVEKKAYGDEL